jgi:GNAT superfamily N-acetyltransferase
VTAGPSASAASYVLHAQTIREATVDDIPALVDMGLRFLRESSYRAVLAENPDQMMRLAIQMVTGEATAILVSETDGGVIVGMFGLVLWPHFISGEMTAGEVFWWVEPSARGAGLRLWQAGEEWARARGAVCFDMIAPNDRVGVLYERHGYVSVERTYRRRFS